MKKLILTFISCCLIYTQCLAVSLIGSGIVASGGGSEVFYLDCNDSTDSSPNTGTATNFDITSACSDIDRAWDIDGSIDTRAEGASICADANWILLIPKLIGSGFGASPFGLGASTPQAGFKVQRLLPVDAAHHIDQNSKYRTYPFGCNGFIYMTNTEFLPSKFVIRYSAVLFP